MAYHHVTAFKIATYRVKQWNMAHYQELKINIASYYYYYIKFKYS